MNHVPREKKIADRLKKRADEAVSSMAGSATFDWEDSVMCNCWNCDSCNNENRTSRSVRPRFCMTCGIKFEKHND